jgi:hypothetical protein
MKDIENFEWNDMLDLTYDGLLSIRCYFLGEDDIVYVGKTNKFGDLFATNIKGSDKPAFRTKPKMWLPLSSNIFPDSYFI